MKILKVAVSNGYGVPQKRYIFDEMPKLTYEQIGYDYVGSACLPSGKVVFSQWLHKGYPKGAFAGNTLHLPMKDGSTAEIKDAWWDAGHYPEHGEFKNVGADTLENLQRCYVYCSLNIAKDALQEMLDEYYSRDRDYTYEEVREWVSLQYTWYPVIMDGKKTTLMVNKNGDFIDGLTMKRVHVQTNVLKFSRKWNKDFHLCFFDWSRVENGRLVKDRRKMTDILKASLPADLYEARLEEMRRRKLI